MQIILTQGRVALIDDIDYPLVEPYTWCANYSKGRYWYAQTNIPYEDGNGHNVVGMHRIILNAPSDSHVDHINSDGLDNRRANLRLATRAQNAQNAYRPLGVSGYRGVSPVNGKWHANIRNNGERIYVGRYATPEEAAHAYDRAAKELHGEFARLNFKDE